MKYIIILLLLSTTAYAKPFKIEKSDGKLTKCGDLNNTEGAWVLRGCPELGDFLANEPTPTPDPTPVPTPDPIPTATSGTVNCSDGFFTDTEHGLITERFYEVENVQHICAKIPKVNLHFIEVQSTNRSNAQCNTYIMLATSPKGLKYESIGTQPGVPITNEQGIWQFDIMLLEDGCPKPFKLQTVIRTKG